MFKNNDFLFLLKTSLCFENKPHILYLTTAFLIIPTILSQEIVPGYWNSLSTHVTVGVPLLDDETLITYDKDELTTKPTQT